MWDTRAIRQWYEGWPGRLAMQAFLDDVKRLPEVPWVGAERPEVLISGVGYVLASPWPTARVVEGLDQAGDDCRYDRIVLLHELERSPDAAALLDRCARLLRPDGRLIVLAANRASPWAAWEAFSPFGMGQAYNHRQLGSLLEEAGLTPVGRGYSLFAPPVAWPWVWHWLPLWRRLFGTRLPWLGAALIAVARKDVLGMKAMKLAPDGSVSLQPVGVVG